MPSAVRRLVVDSQLMSRAIALTRQNRPGTLGLPDYIGRPGMVLISDSHGEVHTYANLYEALPGSVKYGVDLGDTVDRGPNPLEMNYLLKTLRVRKALGNHDAMWLGAGLGIKALTTEISRWLMRYDEMDFLTSFLGISLRPLRDYADKYFKPQDHRIEIKSKHYPDMEAAATYLKIIAEATVRFPEHAKTRLDASELRIRKALFFPGAIADLTALERDVFDRLTCGERTAADFDRKGGEKLAPADEALFYKLMGGLRDFTEEEQTVVDYISGQFLDNYSFYHFVKWMIGDGDIYFVFRQRQDYPCDILATHALIPIDENGELVEFIGLTGRAAMLEVKNRIKIGMEAWRHRLEHGNSTMMEMHQDTIDTLAVLPWDRRSPLYGREMQTAARALLPQGPKKGGNWDEPEVPFYTHFEKAKDPKMLARARANIASSFGMRDPSRFVIVRGHKPNKEDPGMFNVLAGGTVINIDAGMAKAYGGEGGAIIFGSHGATWLRARDMSFHQVSLPGVE